MTTTARTNDSSGEVLARLREGLKVTREELAAAIDSVEDVKMKHSSAK